MAIKKMGLVFIATCFLGLIFEPGRAHGSRKSDHFMSHGSDPPVAQTPPLVGICESFVAVHGYPCKEFKVKTQDGYVLTLHRIPEGRVKGSGKIRQPVLLQHGILMNMDAPDERSGCHKCINIGTCRRLQSCSYHCEYLWRFSPLSKLLEAERDVAVRHYTSMNVECKRRAIENFPLAVLLSCADSDDFHHPFSIGCYGLSLGNRFQNVNGFDYWTTQHVDPTGRRQTLDCESRQRRISRVRLIMDGMSWLLDSPDLSLGFVLADSGFDVWISNTRGTRWSRTHTSLDPINPAFWAWSWDELVEHDLPALFDFVHSQTGQKLHYVGHSLGTLMALASLSQGKLVDQLKSAVLLSPIAYLSHMTTLIGQIAARSFIGEITTWFGLAEFNPIGEAVANFLKALCAYPGIDCYDLMSSLTAVRDGIIAKFDYGNSETNMKYYGQSKPPIYNMSSIPNDLPLFLSYGGQDALSDVRDVELLLDNLKFHDGDKLTVQYIKDFAHADFVMGGSAKKIVYDALIAFFNRW